MASALTIVHRWLSPPASCSDGLGLAMQRVRPGGGIHVASGRSRPAHSRGLEGIKKGGKRTAAGRPCTARQSSSWPTMVYRCPPSASQGDGGPAGAGVPTRQGCDAVCPVGHADIQELVGLLGGRPRPRDSAAAARGMRSPQVSTLGASPIAGQRDVCARLFINMHVAAYVCTMSWQLSCHRPMISHDAGDRSYHRTGTSMTMSRGGSVETIGSIRRGAPSVRQYLSMSSYGYVSRR